MQNTEVKTSTSYIPTAVGMVSLITGFALIRPAYGFICAGVLLLAPLVLPLLKRGK